MKQKDRKADSEQKNFFFGIISQKKLDWSEHTARIVDIEKDTVRIESHEQIDPGYVWMKQRIQGTRGGFLESSIPGEDGYYARIRLKPLSWNVERYVRERARRCGAALPCDRQK
jgi:hypothetical protein